MNETRKRYLIAALLTVLAVILCLFSASFVKYSSRVYAAEYEDGRIFEDFENIALGEPPRYGAHTVPSTDSRTFVFHSGLILNEGTQIIQDEATGNRMLRLGGAYDSATGADNQNYFGTRTFVGFNNIITVKMDICVPKLLSNEFLGVAMFSGGIVSANNVGELFRVASDGANNILQAPRLSGFTAVTLPADEWFTIQAEINASENSVSIFLITQEQGESVCTKVADNLPTTSSVAQSIVQNGLTILRVTANLQRVAKGNGTPNYFLIDNLVVTPEYHRLARSVSIEGEGAVGEQLEGKYSYGFGEETNTSYQWYRAEPAADTLYEDLNFVPIEGANGIYYTVAEEDLGRYLCFEVTPVTSDGIDSVTVRNSEYFSVINNSEDFSSESALGRGVSSVGEGAEVSVADGALIITPDSGSEQLSIQIENAVAYRALETVDWSVSFSADGLLGDAVLEGWLSAELPGENVNGILCFSLSGNILSVGSYGRTVEYGTLITVRTVLMSNGYYYVEAYDASDLMIYRSPSRQIENGEFLSALNKNGVTFARCTYSAQSPDEAPAVRLNALSVKSAGDEYLALESATVPATGVGDETSLDFRVLSSLSEPITYALTEGELPRGLSITDNGIEGIPEEAGTFVFSIDATCGNLTTRAEFSLLVSAYFTVTFETYGGTQIEECIVMDGRLLPEVSEPEREESRFIGWYTDAAFTQPFSIASDAIENDVTLYARWLTKVSVSFDVKGGNPIETLIVYPYELLPEVTCSKTGYLFIGWCTDESYETAWDWQTDTVPEHDITLYANWQAKQYLVTVNYSMGNSPLFITVFYGESIDEPASETVEGYAFEDWYTDAAFTEKYDFSAAVTSSFELYAKYVATEQSDGSGCGSVASAQFIAVSAGITAIAAACCALKRRKAKR